MQRMTFSELINKTKTVPFLEVIQISQAVTPCSGDIVCHVRPAIDVIPVRVQDHMVRVKGQTKEGQVDWMAHEIWSSNKIIINISSWASIAVQCVHQ